MASLENSPSSAFEPAGRLPRALDERIGQSLIVVIALALVSVPMVPLVLQAFIDRPLYDWDRGFTLKNFRDLFALPEIPTLFADTAFFGLVSISFSLTFGILFSLLLGRTNVPGRGVLLNLLLWPIFISPLVIGFGAVLTYGPSGWLTGLVMPLTGSAEPWNLYTVTGIGLISGIAMVPLTILYCISSALQQDQRLEDAARVAGAGPMRILARITVPLMRPAIVYATLMNILAAVEMFAIPLLLGGPVHIQLITTFIYDQGFENSRPNYGLVASAALVLMAIVALLIWLQNRLISRSHRFISIGPKGGRKDLLDLARLRWPAFAFIVLYLALTIGALGIGLVARSFTLVLSPYVSPLEVLTLENYADIFRVDTYRRSILNTLLVAVVGAAVGTALIAAVALVAQRSQYRLRWLADTAVQLPRAVPGLVVSMGVFYAIIFIPGLGFLNGTLIVLGVAYVIRHLPAGYGIVAPALLQIAPDFDRAARVAGASWQTTARRIVLPILKPALASCFTLLTVLFLKEYAAAIFLYRPGNEVMSMTMLYAWIPGDTGPVAALAVIQVLITSGLLWFTTRVFGVKLHG